MCFIEKDFQDAAQGQTENLVTFPLFEMDHAVKIDTKRRDYVLNAGRKIVLLQHCHPYGNWVSMHKRIKDF